jgi:hypothetical protein
MIPLSLMVIEILIFFNINLDLLGFSYEKKSYFDTPKEFFKVNFKNIKVVNISNHKEIIGPTYYSLLIIKCPKFILEQFQGGFGMVKKGVLLKKKNILVAVKDNNIILDFKFNARLRDFSLACALENDMKSYKEL